MNRVAIAFNTCDRVELTKRSIEPLLQPDKFSTWWIDGSRTEEARELPRDDLYGVYKTHRNIRGGSGPAIVYALTTLLNSWNHKGVPGKDGSNYFYNYTHIGLVENDVLLHDNWFDDMMALFERGNADGLNVGAVSARCYEDRILFQRDGYAVKHNIGAGMIMFTREAAELVLANYRTVWTTENRTLFAQLSGIDLATYWAFRGNQHMLVADWNFDRVLAAHGLASLALTPNRITMLDQDIGPLGLKYADGNPPEIITGNAEYFERYRDNLAKIREGKLKPGAHIERFHDGQSYTIFPHQIPRMGGLYQGDWRIRDFLGFGPFCWKAGPGERAYGEHSIYPGTPELVVPVCGPCDVVVSGGETGGNIRIEDEQSGYDVEPFVQPEAAGMLQISVPGSAGYRRLRLTTSTPGVCFMGLKTREPQITLPHIRFDYSTLPPV
jgi:hypothetical protein